MLSQKMSDSTIRTLLKLSTVDDVEGAFPKTILHFLKNNKFTLSVQATSEIFATFREALWVSRQTMLRMDSESGVFGKRIRAQNSQSELLLAFFKNIIAQFKFTPFFPDSVKGDLQLNPLKVLEPETGKITYGVTDSFSLYVEGSVPIEFSIYLGDGRNLRDIQRMIEENADIRALKDVFGFLGDDSYKLFPLIPYQKIEKQKDHQSLIIKNTILDETYQLKFTITNLQGTDMKGLEIQEETKNPVVFSCFVLDEVESNIKEGDKGWELLRHITQKSPAWFKKRHLRYRHFVENGEEINEIPPPEGYQTITLPVQYEEYWNPQTKDLKIIEILTPRYRIIAPRSGTSFRIDIEFTAETYENLYRPQPVGINCIFTRAALEDIHLLQNAKSVGYLIGEKIMSLLNMLETSYRSLSFLMMNNTVVAGAFTYLTYFGRDTVFTHILLKPFLLISIQQKTVQQLLNRANKKGEAAHEIDSRIRKGYEDHYDYRMADTDFLMTVSTLELLNELEDDACISFLAHQDIDNRYNVNSLIPSDRVDNATVIFRNLNHILKKIIQYDIIPLKRENDPSSANWRDAINSFSRGTYPYDVNAVWIPHIFHLLESLRKNTNKKNILVDFLAKTKHSFPDENFSQIETFFDLTNNDLKKRMTQWTEKIKRIFLLVYSLGEWRVRLQSFYNDPTNQVSAIQDLKKMKIGYYLREHGQGKVWFTAEEFLDERKWEDSMKFQFEHLEGKFFLPNGNPFPKEIRTYAMALDKKKKPIPILHSDLGFEAFTKSIRGDRIEDDLIFPTELPLPLGGLAIIDKNGASLGFSVANPMLAEKNGYALLLSPHEKKDGVDPKTLSPWQLLGKNEYHGWGAIWEMMIDFMVSALQDTDIQNQDYLKRHYWWLLENYTRFSRVRNREVLGFKYNSDYEDWFLTESTVEKFEINDLQVFNAAGRLRVLLKSLIPGITNFWIFKQAVIKKQK